jgi:hypothetical protein
MWICPDCNSLVPNPIRKKCPNGHGLFDGGICSSTSETSTGAAFLNAFLICLALAGAAVLDRSLYTTQPVSYILTAALFIFLAAGLTGFVRGMKWRGQGGPVMRLVPRANGMAMGCAAAAACLAVYVLRG